MEIKKEEPKDYAEIYEVVKRAFNSAECADGNEQDLVNALRTGDSYNSCWIISRPMTRKNIL